MYFIKGYVKITGKLESCIVLRNENIVLWYMSTQNNYHNEFIAITTHVSGC